MARERRYGLLVAAALAGSLGVGGVGCGENPVPERPTYSRDIKPLMEAHCIRCHGAGGKLNADPDATPVMGVQAPISSDFTRLDDVGMVFGLMHFTGTAGAINLKFFLDHGPMPPPPAEPLTDREYTTLLTWANNPLQ